jgi:hypothetical protein
MFRALNDFAPVPVTKRRVEEPARATGFEPALFMLCDPIVWLRYLRIVQDFGVATQRSCSEFKHAHQGGLTAFV